MSEVLGIFMSVADAPSAARSVTAGRFDANVCDFAWYFNSTTGAGPSITFSNNEAVGNVTWYHFCWYQDAMSASHDGWCHSIKDGSGNTIVLIDISNGAIRLNVTGSTTVYTAFQPAPANNLVRIDISVNMSAGVDVQLYMNGGRHPYLSVGTGDAGVRTKPVTLLLNNQDTPAMYISEVYVADFDTRHTRPVKQVPNAVGAHTAWTGGFTELGDEDIATAADGAVAGDKLSVNVDPYPGPASLGGINRVVAKVLGSRGSAGPQNIDPFVRIGGVDYSAGNINPTETPLQYYPQWAINPATGVEWGTAALDTTEFGLEAKT